MLWSIFIAAWFKWDGMLSLASVNLWVWGPLQDLGGCCHLCLSPRWITIDSLFAFFSSLPATASPSHAAFPVENNRVFLFPPSWMWTLWSHWLCSSFCIYVLWWSEESYSHASYPQARSGHLSVWRPIFFCFRNKSSYAFTLCCLEKVISLL